MIRSTAHHALLNTVITIQRIMRILLNLQNQETHILAQNLMIHITVQAKTTSFSVRAVTIIFMAAMEMTQLAEDQATIHCTEIRAMIYLLAMKATTLSTEGQAMTLSKAATAMIHTFSQRATETIQ